MANCHPIDSSSRRGKRGSWARSWFSVPMHLVSLIVAIEREVEDIFGVMVTLVDERALSMKESPFCSIQSLRQLHRHPHKIDIRNG